MTRRTWDGQPLTPGYNVDRIDVEAGLRHAAGLGYSDWRSRMVISYALALHARGEEDVAQRAAIGQGHEDKTGCVDLTSWYQILAAARAAAEQEAQMADEPKNESSDEAPHVAVMMLFPAKDDLGRSPHPGEMSVWREGDTKENTDCVLLKPAAQAITGREHFMMRAGVLFDQYVQSMRSRGITLPEHAEQGAAKATLQEDEEAVFETPVSDPEPSIRLTLWEQEGGAAQAERWTATLGPQVSSGRTIHLQVPSVRVLSYGFVRELLNHLIKQKGLDLVIFELASESKYVGHNSSVVIRVRDDYGFADRVLARAERVK